jgi:outer membrane protein assembly factor BamB
MIRTIETGRTVMQKPVRLLPGVTIVAFQWVVRFVIPLIFPKAMAIGVFGGILAGLAVIVWWIFFSRAPRIERWSAPILVFAALFGTTFLLDESIKTAMMGLMFIIYSIPVISLAFVIWAVASRKLSIAIRRVTMVLTIILASGFWIFIRTNGMDGNGRHDLAFRWAKTEEDLLPERIAKVSANKTESGTHIDQNIIWPGFRGNNRDGVVYGTTISTNWSQFPPAEIWRRPVGPGCSSFAVHGNLLYTQEQRGENEVVSCYNLTNGKPVWQHSDKARFYDSHAGAGPRSTPTLSGNRIYTLGATGILNVLDANDGSVIWTRNAANDNRVKAIPWGFAGSPLVVSDLVIVSISGNLAAYDTVSGNPRWSEPDTVSSYSSPHLLNFKGTSQILFMNDAGAISVDPASGKKLWEYPWRIDGRILQPALLDNGDLLFSAENKSIRRVAVENAPEGYTVKELWNSSEIKVNFNDFVIHKGYGYSFDGPSIACIDLKDGRRLWRGARYRGFILLLADQDLLLILTEKGELALVKADSNKFTELSLIPAINGKTWNHPVLVGNILIVRNAQEMAAFRLPMRD